MYQEPVGMSRVSTAELPNAKVTEMTIAVNEINRLIAENK